MKQTKAVKSVRNEKRCSIIVLTRFFLTFVFCVFFGSEMGGIIREMKGGELLGNTVYAHGMKRIIRDTMYAMV